MIAAGTITIVVLTVIAVLAALIYFRNPEKRTCFRPWTSLFGFRRGDGRVQYYRVRRRERERERIHLRFSPAQVDTTEEARLLLDASDPTQCQTDSDDDLLHA